MAHSRTSPRRIILAALLAGLVAADVSLSRSGIFNNKWSPEAAMREHDASMARLLRRPLTTEQVNRAVANAGGTCEGAVKEFVLNGRDYDTSGVTICTVNLGGRILMPFVAHKWDCAFAPQPNEHVRLIGCQRQSGSL